MQNFAKWLTRGCEFIAAMILAAIFIIFLLLLFFLFFSPLLSRQMFTTQRRFGLFLFSPLLCLKGLALLNRL